MSKFRFENCCCLILFLLILLSSSLSINSSSSVVVAVDEESFDAYTSLDTELQNILLEHKIRSSKIGQIRAGNASEPEPIRFRRDMPSIHMKKGRKKLRVCANMNGILGGLFEL